MKRATSFYGNDIGVEIISIHALVKRATNYIKVVYCFFVFQSTPS